MPRWAAPGKQTWWLSRQWTKRFISEEKVERDKIAMAMFRYLRLQRLWTSGKVKPDAINNWVGNSQQIMVLIKVTLFLATDKLLKLLEVLYLLTVITNWALYAEDQCQHRVSVKSPKALETDSVPTSKVFWRLWGSCQRVNSTYSCLLQSREELRSPLISCVGGRNLVKWKQHTLYISMEAERHRLCCCCLQKHHRSFVLVPYAWRCPLCV